MKNTRQNNFCSMNASSVTSFFRIVAFFTVSFELCQFLPVPLFANSEHSSLICF